MSKTIFLKNIAIVTATIASFVQVYALDSQSGSADTANNGTGSVNTMSAEELLNFYKKNKDYGKKRIGLDYQKYIDGDWVVLRGEFFDRKDGKPIANEKVRFIINGKEYISVTTKEGVFNLEIKKADIKDEVLYRIYTILDHFSVQSPDIEGKKLKTDSIYHFKIERVWKNEVEYGMSLSTIHNGLFTEGSDGFVFQEKIMTTPSLLGIQSTPLWAIALLAITLLGFFFFRHKLAESEKPISRKPETE